MNVKKLKELIKDLPDDMEVVLQKNGMDWWGNPLSEGYLGVYEDGSIFTESDTHEEVQLFDTKQEWKEFIDTAPRSLVLKPSLTS
jgi:hypothetical protein